MQIIESGYGRESITVSDACPTVALSVCRVCVLVPQAQGRPEAGGLVYKGLMRYRLTEAES